MKKSVLITVIVAAVIMLTGCSDEVTDAQMLTGIEASAESGNAGAQFMLGSLYAEGNLVENDFSEATKWFYRAANQGHPQAQYSLGIIYSGGRNGPVELAKGYVWFCLAAEFGIAIAAEDCKVLADELSPEELETANHQIATLITEIQGKME